MPDIIDNRPFFSLDLQRIALMVLLVSSIGNLSAQNRISGTLLDADTQESLVGGYLKLTTTLDSLEYFSVSDHDGSFNIDVPKKGDYHLEISYLSYRTLVKDFQVSGDIDLGAIHLQHDATDLSEIKITATMSRVVQKGDTTQYNANAYKTNPNASTEELLQKMPGFVATDGNMEVQGEKVARILVNGKPYFGDDPSMALKNLPAEAIESVEVFDQSDDNEGEEEGSSDGNTRKTINIVLKESYNSRFFGNIHGGVGTDNRYKAGANLNFFKGDQRINFLGQFNNINRQNFSSADLLGVTATARSGSNAKGRTSSKNFLVRQKGGINTTNAAGINYQDIWNDNIEVSASYFFNNSANINQTDESRDFLNRKLPFLIDKGANHNSDNINHRVDARIRYKINDRNTLLFIPSLTIQENTGQSTDDSQTFSNDQLTNQLSNIFSSDLSAYNISNKMVFTHRLKKRRRQINFVIQNRLLRSDGDRLAKAINTNSSSSETISLDQNSLLENSRQYYSISARYQEPLNKRSTMTIGYTFGNDLNDAEILTSSYNISTDDYDLLEDSYSSVFNNIQQSHKGELSYRYRKKKLTLNLGGFAQIAYLDNEQTFPETANTHKSFRNILPNILIRYNLSKSRYLHFSFKSRTQIPKVSDLQNVTNNSNPLRVRFGNPNLKQQVNHTLELKYSSNNSEKSSVFYAYLQSRVINDFIGQEVTFVTEPDTINGVSLPVDAQTRRPVNLSGYWSTRSFMTYGVPMPKLKSNFNVNVGLQHRRIPLQSDGQTIFTNTEKVRVGAVLSSNISEAIDFTIRTTASLDFAQSASRNAQIFNQNTQAVINYIFNKHWQLNSNFTHRYYDTYGGTPIEDFFLWNASIEYRFLKDQKAEIGVSVFDILKSNVRIQQRYTENFLLQQESLTLRQYAMMTFRYRA